jgi:hypothetical protein
MKRCLAFFMAICLLGSIAYSIESEFGTFRLLSISESEKLILVSQIPGKEKFLLDAASAKITLNGKPAEYKALKMYSVIQVRKTETKSKKQGISIDGSAIEIRIKSGESVE